MPGNRYVTWLKNSYSLDLNFENFRMKIKFCTNIGKQIFEWSSDNLTSWESLREDQVFHTVFHIFLSVQHKLYWGASWKTEIISMINCSMSNSCNHSLNLFLLGGKSPS